MLEGGIQAATEGMLIFLPIGISILALVFNYNTQVRANRKRFAKVLVAISIVPLMFLYSDMTFLFGWPQLPFNLPLKFLHFAWAALAAPFYATLCRRIFDAALSKHLALLGLIPFLNYLFFLYLCVRPSRYKEQATR